MTRKQQVRDLKRSSSLRRTSGAFENSLPKCIKAKFVWRCCENEKRFGDLTLQLTERSKFSRFEKYHDRSSSKSHYSIDQTKQCSDTKFESQYVGKDVRGVLALFSSSLTQVLSRITYITNNSYPCHFLAIIPLECYEKLNSRFALEHRYNLLEVEEISP